MQQLVFIQHWCLIPNGILDADIWILFLYDVTCGDGHMCSGNSVVATSN
jgi:hypothetical protein